MHAWDQSEMQRFFRAHACSCGKFRWINFADQICKLCSRRKSFCISLAAVPPCDWSIFWRRVCQHFASRACDRLLRIFVHRATWNVQVWQPLVKKIWKHSHQSTLALTLLAKKENVMSRNDRSCKFRQNRVVITQDAWKQT